MNELFDNQRGFQPVGKVLSLWTLLPQVSTTLDQKRIPPLFGNLKNLSVYYIAVGLLITMELILIFYLNNEGVSPLVLGALSAVDFFVAILPYFYELDPKRNTSLIDANIYITETKLSIQQSDSDNNTAANLNAELKEHKEDKQSAGIKSFLMAVLIIGLGAWKFWNYWGVFGNDIFVEPVGRFIIISIILSIVVHLTCTKVVFYHQLFNLGLNKQLDEFRNKTQTDYHILDDMQNQRFALNYKVPYNIATAGNQKIRQEYRADSQPKEATSNSDDEIEEIICNKQKVKFFKNKIEGFKNVYLLHTGILLEKEMNSISLTQPETKSKKAVVAACKEIQKSKLG